MRPVVLLAELNDIDAVVDARQARLAEIAAALREPASLRAARAAVQEGQAELARWQAAQAERERQQKVASDKVVAAEQQLYGGKVKNPKELSDIEREREQWRRQRSKCDDELLEALVGVEDASGQLEARQAVLAREMEAWVAEQGKLRTEQARLAARLPAEQARQASARRAVPPQYLSVYDSLRTRRTGRAVAKLDGDVCGACGVAVAPTRLEAARYSDELIYCDNCGRLIWDE